MQKPSSMQIHLCGVNSLVLAIFCWLIVALYNPVTVADELSNCLFMAKSGLTHKVIPSCFTKNKHPKETAELFRWLYDELYFEYDAAKYFAFLEKIKGRLYKADYLLLKGMVLQLDQKPKQALVCLKKSADLGNAEAAYYVSGIINSDSKTESERYLKLSADGGYSFGQFSWGVDLFYGRVNPQNKAKGLEYIELAAYQNNSTAMTKLLEMRTSLDHDSYIFWQLMERIYLESYSDL